MTATLYVEEVHGDPTIWLRTPDNPNGDEPALIRTGANAKAFDALAALVDAAIPCPDCTNDCANPACFMPAALLIKGIGYCGACGRQANGGRL